MRKAPAIPLIPTAIVFPPITRRESVGADELDGEMNCVELNSVLSTSCPSLATDSTTEVQLVGRIGELGEITAMLGEMLRLRGLATPESVSGWSSDYCEKFSNIAG